MADAIDNSLARELEEMEDQRDAVTFMLARMEQANDDTWPWRVVERLNTGEHPVSVFRDLRGMSRDDPAIAANTTPDAIQAIEDGGEEGHLRLLLAIARAVRVDLDDLVPWDGAGDAAPGD